MLSGAIPSFEMFMTRWEQLLKKNECLEPLMRPGLDAAYKYYKRMDRTSSYVVAMRTWTQFYYIYCSRLMIVYVSS